MGAGIAQVSIDKKDMFTVLKDVNEAGIVDEFCRTPPGGEFRADFELKQIEYKIILLANLQIRGNEFEFK